MAALFALMSLFWAQTVTTSNSGFENPMSGGYQLFETSDSRVFANNPLSYLEKIFASPEIAPECCNATKGGFKPFKSTDTEYSVDTKTYPNSDIIELEISGSPEQYMNAQLAGSYSDGNLKINFYSTDVPGQNIGTEMISNAIETVGSNNVSTVSGQFGLTNKSVYDTAIQSGSSSVDAAWSTPLGKAMSELGFTSVEVTSGYNPSFVFGYN